MEFEELSKSMLVKIKKLRDDRGWSVYKLAEETGMNPQTIHNWYKTDAIPSLQFLFEICKAFNITLSEFFSEGEIFELTSERKEHFEEWSKLSKPQREAVRVIIKSYLDS